MDDLVYDVDEAARMLRIRRSKLYQLLQSGELGSVHVGRRRLVPRAELERYIEHLQELEAR